MSTDKSNDQNQDRKKLLKSDLKEGLEGLKEILVATLALIMNISETLPRSIRSSSLSSFKKTTSKKEVDSALSLVRGSNSDENSQAVDISVEVPKKGIRDYYLILIKTFLYPALALVSTGTLIIGVQKISPLSKWAETQNECIEKTKSVDGISSPDLANKVMKCNGGHSL